MMERIELADDVSWRFVPDATPAPGDRVRAVMRARVLDETTRTPIGQFLHISTRRADLAARVSDDGIVGLVGQPARALPRLGSSAEPLDMRIESANYLPLDLACTLGPIVNFPQVFAPFDFGDVSLHRIGVALEGRVVRRAPIAPVPLAGATIRLEGVWSTLPPANWNPPALAEPPRLVALTPGLYAPRGGGTTLRQRALTPKAAVQTLLAPVAIGSRRIRLSDRKGLLAGGDLMLDRDDAMRTEVIKIRTVESTLADDLPSWITLEHPCARSHLDGVACVAVDAQPAIVVDTLARAAIPGDRVGFTSATPAFVDGAFVEIDDGIAAHEWQRVAGYATKSDADGYFRLPAVARVALLQLHVKSAPLTDALPVVSLDYRAAVQRLTIELE
jgi:hypothetical protein